jgi:hypothetical protein
MVDLGILARGGAVPGFSLGGNAWLGNRLGMAYRYEVACHDGEDRTQLVCNDETDIAYVHVELSGTVELPRLHLQLGCEGDWTIYGLTANAATLHGSGLVQLESRVERPDGTVTFELTYGADYRGIELARGEAWPRDGSIAYALEIRRTGAAGGTADTRDFALDARLDLGPSGHAMLTLDGAQHYRIELETGEVARMAQ